MKAFAKVQASDSVPLENLIVGLQRYMRTKPPDRPWCNPATWLNEGRWVDEPASSLTTLSSTNGGKHSIDLGGGNSAKPSVIRDLWSRDRWPPDWGPDPNQPGCRIPAETMAQIMDQAA